MNWFCHGARMGRIGDRKPEEDLPEKDHRMVIKRLLEILRKLTAETWVK